MRKLALALCVALFAATACWPFDDDAPLTEMTLALQRGVMEVLRGEELIEVSDRASIQPGDVIQGGSGALARLRLEGGRILHLAGFGSKLDVRIVAPDEVEGRSGNVLADAGEPTTVVFGQIEATASNATFRVDRGIASTRASAYEGEVRLTAPGEPTLNVGRLRQVAVAADDLPSVPDPYRLDTEDYWDRLFLRNLVDLQSNIEQLAIGFQNQLGESRPGVAYFEALAGGRDASFMRRYLRRTSAVNLLIAFNIALRVPKMSLGDAFRKTFRLFERGASWGVVADIMGVTPRVLVASLERIVESATRGRDLQEPEFTVAAAEEASSSGSSSSGGSSPSSGGGGSGDANTGGGGDGNDEPPPEKPKDEEEECQDFDIDCTVDDILPDESPSPSPSSL
ncbi:MAG: hypothetical protein ACRDJJ_05105 [Actinomycetota bacterium]